MAEAEGLLLLPVHRLCQIFWGQEVEEEPLVSGTTMMMRCRRPEEVVVVVPGHFLNLLHSWGEEAATAAKGCSPWTVLLARSRQ
jgi:hypothetical protein